MKVFFDTNVYLSEALTHGAAERAITATIKASWRVYHSNYLLDEIERVLVEQLGFTGQLARLIRLSIRRRSLLVEPPPSRHGVPEDPKDTPILQAAIAVGADLLVSSDKHLLDLNPYEGIEIISLPTYILRLEEQGHLPKR